MGHSLVLPVRRWTELTWRVRAPARDGREQHYAEIWQVTRNCTPADGVYAGQEFFGLQVPPHYRPNMPIANSESVEQTSRSKLKPSSKGHLSPRRTAAGKVQCDHRGGDNSALPPNGRGSAVEGPGHAWVWAWGRMSGRGRRCMDGEGANFGHWVGCNF